MGEAAGKIRDISKLLEGVPNLGIFMGDFSEHNENIYPTDIDGAVEIKGNFLIHEYKKENIEINQGQQIMQDSLISKGFSIVNIWHRGSCWDMNFIKTEIFVPDTLAYNGQTSWLFNEDVLNRVKHFHKWWTNQVLNI